jgi:hypothetical protein
MEKDNSMGFLEAAKEGVKEFVTGMYPGANLKDALSDMWAETKRLGVQGQAELAQALFSDGAYVPYGRGQGATQQQSAEVKQEQAKEEPQQEQSRGGRSM